MTLTGDGSNYSGPLTPKIVKDLRAFGMDKYVCGIDLRPENIALARQQLSTARDGGMRLGAYREAYWGNDAESDLLKVLAALDGFEIEDMGIAFEDKAAETAPFGGYSATDAVCAWIEHFLNVAGTLWGPERVLCYTAAWWWNPYTASTTRFSGWPLWVAQYDGMPDLNFQHFGGWTTCRRKQFRGSTDCCHYNLDLNYEVNTMATPTPESNSDRIDAINATRILAAQALLDDMDALVKWEIAFGVLPPGTVALKPHIATS